MKIVVLAGGYSPEREVSLCSASLIANALMRKGHRVLLLDVYEGISELPCDPESLFLENGYRPCPPLLRISAQRQRALGRCEVRGGRHGQRARARVPRC